MGFVLCAVALSLLSLAAAGVILLHALQRSLGTFVMVLLIPAFIVYYAFTQFEHRRKGAVIAVWLGALVLAGVCNATAAHAVIPAPPAPMEYAPPAP